MCITFSQAWIGEDDRNGAGPLLLPRPLSVRAMVAAHLGGPEVLELKALMREGARQGSSGYVADVIAEFRPWGFSLRDLRTEVLVWWGESDRLVTRAYAEYLAKAIPRAKLITYPSEGHLFLVNHWAEMPAALL